MSHFLDVRQVIGQHIRFIIIQLYHSGTIHRDYFTFRQILTHWALCGSQKFPGLFTHVPLLLLSFVMLSRPKSERSSKPINSPSHSLLSRMQHLLMHYKKLLTLPFHNLGICHPQRSPSDPSQGLRILIAPSGFKECLGPEEVADCIEAGFRRVLVDENDDTTTTTTATPGVLRKVPLHDGGEGFCKAIVALHGGEIRNLTVTGPDRRPVDSYFGLIADADDRKVAVLDMAAAAGLRLVPRDHRDPCVTTTYGVGELIRAALDEGCTKVIIGCGDSGTSDAGAGMLQALGARLLDGDGADLEIGGGGGSLADLERISLDGIHPRLRKDGGKRNL